MLKPLALYMLGDVWSYLVIFYAILEVNFSYIRKVVLDEFVCREGILFI